MPFTLFLVKVSRQTMQPVSKPMNSHRFDINNFVDNDFSTSVAIHFNSEDHNLNNFSFMPINIGENNMERLCKGTYWIHKLKTLNPYGLNTKDIF
jgi:hypothetical protein